MKPRITSLHVREKKSVGRFILITWKGERVEFPHEFSADLETIGRGWVFYSLDGRVWYHRRYGNAGINGMYRANVAWENAVYHFKTEYAASDFLSRMTESVYGSVYASPDTAIFD